MDDLGLVSIITPTYNCAQYIGETIDTVISQTYINWEMIIVDDCSSDDTDKIVSKYQKRDSRIKYYRLANNSGAAVARTVAMRLASGKYIAFLDSDDWIKDESLSLLYDEAVKHHADVVMGNMWLCHQDGSMDKPFKCISNGSIKELLSGKESFIELVKTCFYLPTPVRYIYNRKYLHKMQARFEEGIMHEDELWCPIVLCQAERMVITNIEFYYYRQNEESVMHTTSLARRLKSLFQVT